MWPLMHHVCMSVPKQCYPKWTGDDCSVRLSNHRWVNPTPYGQPPPPLRAAGAAVPLVPGSAGADIVYIFGIHSHPNIHTSY
jgi:hypothetical protein